MRVRVLSVGTLLQAGHVLLESVSMHRIIQEKRKIRVQVEKGTSQKPVQFKRVAVCKGFAVIRRESSECHAAAIGRVDIAEAVEQPRSHQVQGALAGGIKQIAAED